MTTTIPHTLSQLADIGAAAAFADPSLKGSWHLTASSLSDYWKQEQPAREAFAKAILNAIGYKLSVDPEREAFDVWFFKHISEHGKLDPFEVWKVGRDELRKAQMLDKEPSQPENDGWIDWPGGDCPVDGTVTVQVQYRLNNFGGTGNAGGFRWNHSDTASDIIAYKIVKP
jgi:hypothetical protein